MAKIKLFSDETMKGINKLVATEDGRAVIEYGKGNFLLGGLYTVAFGLTGYSVYYAVKAACHIADYLRQ